MRKLVYLLLVVTTLYSCDCTRYAKNIVADKETRMVIQGVEVFSVAATNGKQSGEKYVYTDSTGMFETSFSADGIAKCPVLKLTLNKAGYVTQREIEPNVGDTIFLKRAQ